jgi:hypothetical protein
MKSRRPYQQRTDLQRIASQWRKLTGLHSREEWSAAIVRTATAAEIAANLAIRNEFSTRSQFDAKFVDSLLKWANGISGKMDHLLLPIYEGHGRHQVLKRLRTTSAKIHRIRNDIVHRGIFCNEREAREAIAHAKTFVETLVRFYEPGFKLKEANC